MSDFLHHPDFSLSVSLSGGPESHTHTHTIKGFCQTQIKFPRLNILGKVRRSNVVKLKAQWFIPEKNIDGARLPSFALIFESQKLLGWKDSPKML